MHENEDRGRSDDRVGHWTHLVVALARCTCGLLINRMPVEFSRSQLSAAECLTRNDSSTLWMFVLLLRLFKDFLVVQGFGFEVHIEEMTKRNSKLVTKDFIYGFQIRFRLFVCRLFTVALPEY